MRPMYDTLYSFPSRVSPNIENYFQQLCLTEYMSPSPDSQHINTKISCKLTHPKFLNCMHLKQNDRTGKRDVCRTCIPVGTEDM
jgi:hypothetical protein